MAIGVALPLWLLLAAVLYILYRKGLIGGRR
jgi:hypothetical protein